MKSIRLYKRDRGAIKKFIGAMEKRGYHNWCPHLAVNSRSIWITSVYSALAFYIYATD